MDWLRSLATWTIVLVAFLAFAIALGTILRHRARYYGDVKSGGGSMDESADDGHTQPPTDGGGPRAE